MKKKLAVSFVLVAVVLVSILAGCGDAATETTQTAVQDGTASTESSVTTEPATPDATETTSGGIEIPQAVPGSYTDLTPEQAKQLIDTVPDLVVIDVSPHYAEGHLPGAVSYYLGDGSLEEAIPTLDPGATYLVYCHVDSVAIAGAQMLVDAGFTTVYRLQGNYSAWVDAGYPVER